MKSEKTPQPIFLKDYKAPDFLVDSIDMYFSLHEESCGIHAKMMLRSNPRSTSPATEVTLDGEELKLEKLVVEGRELTPNEYTLNEKQLRFAVSRPVPQDVFTVEIWTRVEPQKNLAFDGLFKSGGNFLTQCEPEGFRRMTYFPDRPDVMSRFTVTIEADKARYPILLANGNKIASKDLGQGRHLAQWQDPFPKPAYLFALVAGDFGILEDTYTTHSGRKVLLQIFSRKGHEERCRWAMTSLQQAMKWDEEVYGLEYDLDIYMLVVTDDFNMGAMENKGLNIFNSVYVLADTNTATDADYHAIQSVVGHEYFHNWTGNRVTCRDWFQLSLKEGLTVFRDQQFSADMTSHAVRRIEEVTRLRTEQFAEDAGPMAHPVRPASYIEINNFYTRTIYEKGAEVIRMIHTILGPENFRKGMDRYFELFDGQGVRTEDFVYAMESASGMDLTQFKIWYDQAGTPVVKIEYVYEPATQTLALTLRQSCAPTPGQTEKLPLHIPIRVGLLGADGRDLPLTLENESNDGASLASGKASDTTRVLHLRTAQQTFRFKNIPARPVISILRDFSAPVRLEQECTNQDLSFQLAHDSDAFCRWEAGQRLTIRTVQALVAKLEGSANASAGGTEADELLTGLVRAFKVMIKDTTIDPALKALLLDLPPEPYLSQFFSLIRPQFLHEARETVLNALARACEATLKEIYESLQYTTNAVDAKSCGERALRNICLSLLVRADRRHVPTAVAAFRQAKNMTEELGAVATLNRSADPEREVVLREFYDKWKDEALVMNKWLHLQAISPLADTLERVQRLAHDPVFDETNPNKVGSLFVRFATQNHVRFHDPSGAAYRFLADRILAIDERNPQLAARLVSAFNPWRRYEPNLQALMKAELDRILAKQNLSKNVFEIVSKALD